MLVLSLCNKFCPDKLPVCLGIKLGDGADGELFSIENEPDKVIKLSVLYDTEGTLLEKFQKIEALIGRIMIERPSAYVRVYAQGYLGKFSRDTYGGKQEFILYYYIMEKLEKITEDERKVFHSILSHEDREIKKDFSPLEMQKMLAGLGRGLDFSAEKVTLFCNNINDCDIKHCDLHARNVMMSATGSFKLVDIDRLKMEN